MKDIHFTDEQGNEYRYFITVRRPIINGKVQNCTIDDFAIKIKLYPSKEVYHKKKELI